MFSEKEDIRTYHNLTGSEQFLEEEQEAKVKFFYVVYEAHWLKCYRKCDKILDFYQLLKIWDEKQYIILG